MLGDISTSERVVCMWLVLSKVRLRWEHAKHCLWWLVTLRRRMPEDNREPHSARGGERGERGERGATPAGRSPLSASTRFLRAWPTSDRAIRPAKSLQRSAWHGLSRAGLAWTARSYTATSKLPFFIVDKTSGNLSRHFSGEKLTVHWLRFFTPSHPSWLFFMFFYILFDTSPFPFSRPVLTVDWSRLVSQRN